jgi:FixJ family two-component response regulator
VAVIDDDDDTREALDGLLRSAGLRAEAYSSVQVFMQSGRQQQVRCLILDVWMPGRSGLDFQDDLAGCGLYLPIIFISGRADVPMSVRAMRAGAVEFFTKPVHHQDLLDAVQLAISSHSRAY